MKMLILFLLAFPFAVFAQSVDVNEVPTDSESSTTIEVTKGKKADHDIKWEVVDGAAPVTGEPAAMEKDARKSWKTACQEWKKDFREDNKESRVISVNCGSPECSGTVGHKVCASTAHYKIKTKVAE